MEKVRIKTGIFYKKGETAQINFGDYNRKFKVKRPFVFHGFKNPNKLIVTIPATLGTLKGLGFIGSVKESKE